MGQFSPGDPKNLRFGQSAWLQRRIALTSRRRGFHLITGEIEAAIPELSRWKVGLANLFLLHTSASLTINENADVDVRTDLERSFSSIAPENFPYVHTMEGPDDMPAHVKSSLLGASLTIPIAQGEFVLGTWQGIYLCEHRNHGGSRQLVITLQGLMDGES